MATSRENPGGSEPYRDAEPFSISAQGLDLTFYASGKDRLAAVLDLIGSAQQSLKLYFYIFDNDDCGAQVRDALAEAAKRGVSVTLIVDDFGSPADNLFLAPLTQAGGKVKRFSARWSVRYLIRNHQKMLIMDDRAALIGGFNISQAYFDPPEKNGWNDLGVLITGAAIARLVDWFSLLDGWTDQSRIKLLEASRQVRHWEAGSGTVRWLVGGPSQRLSPWARCVIGDIERASRLDMMVAYFSPRAASSGVSRRSRGEPPCRAKGRVCCSPPSRTMPPRWVLRGPITAGCCVAVCGSTSLSRASSTRS